VVKIFNSCPTAIREGSQLYRRPHKTAPWRGLFEPKQGEDLFKEGPAEETVGFGRVGEKGSWRAAATFIASEKKETGGTGGGETARRRFGPEN